MYVIFFKDSLEIFIYQLVEKLRSLYKSGLDIKGGSITFSVYYAFLKIALLRHESHSL